MGTKLLIRRLTDHPLTPFLFFGALAALVCLDQWLPIRLIPPCPSRLLTGLRCPGCGSGHAALALLDGRFSDAFLANPFMMLVLPLLLLALAHDLFRPEQAIIPRLPGWSITLLAAGLVIFTVVRNLI